MYYRLSANARVCKVNAATLDSNVTWLEWDLYKIATTLFGTKSISSIVPLKSSLEQGTLVHSKSHA